MTQQLVSPEPVLEISTEELSTLLIELSQIGSDFLRRGHYTIEEIRRQREIARLLTAGGIKW